MTNGNLIAFDIHGNQVKLLSDKLYNQGILGNRQVFYSDGGEAKVKGYRPIYSAIINKKTIEIFNGHQKTTYMIKNVKKVENI